MCEVTHYQQPLALDALAAAYAETGRFTEAAITAKKAIKLVSPDVPEAFTSGLKERLELYQTKHPYRQRMPKKNEG